MVQYSLAICFSVPSTSSHIAMGQGLFPAYFGCLIYHTHEALTSETWHSSFSRIAFSIIALTP
jgi:hypothetical protein